MKSHVNQQRFLSVFIVVLILLNMNLAGCKKESTETTTDETKVGTVCSTTSIGTDNLPNITGYPIVGTNQTKFYNNTTEITAPASGSTIYGQNATYPGNVPHYVNNGDGTIADMVTGLMWKQSPDNNCDGIINYDDKVSYSAAVARAEGYQLGGHSDWRLPTIKELYSLIEFSGFDPNVEATSSAGLTPFIDTNYFKFG